MEEISNPCDLTPFLSLAFRDCLCLSNLRLHQDSSKLPLITFLFLHFGPKLSITLYCLSNKLMAWKSYILAQSYLSSLMVHILPLTFFTRSS